MCRFIVRIFYGAQLIRDLAMQRHLRHPHGANVSVPDYAV